MKKRIGTSSQGFSLIELMIVVALMGILASIAIPNYQEFVKQARRAEAKSNLSGIYAAEMGFYAENNSYSQDFNTLGFSTNGLQYFGYGFNLVVPPPGVCGSLCAYLSPSCNPRPNCSPESLHGLDSGYITFANSSKFRVSGHIHWGNVQSGAETWVIDDKRFLQRLTVAN